MRILTVNFWIVAATAVGLAVGSSAATLVVPGQLANANGDGSASFQFNNERIQQAYSSGLFSALAAPAMEISEVRFRVDPFSPTFSSNVEVELRLSTTLQNPDGLNLAFASNIGPDEVVALPRSTLLWQGNPGSSFDVVVPLPNHFVYMPSKGHLLMDITLFKVGTQAGNLDAQLTAGDGMSILFGATTTPTGNITGEGFVTAFTYQAVPEPSTWTLATLGLVAILKGRKHVASRDR
jgi:hypothetical protein